MKLKDKVVIITGASYGIGKSLVFEFAKRGANLTSGSRQYFTLYKITGELQK